jgi:uncharacterized protein
MSLLLRAQVATAAHDVVPAWPLDSFIAVNPLAAAESRPFGSSAGVGHTRPTADYLADLDRGRITVDDLTAAIERRVPALARSLTIDGRAIAASHIAALDLTMRADAAAPAPRPAADPLDDYLSAWLSAYLSPDPLWEMPHRDRGFYGAWRALAPGDRALPRRLRRRVRELPTEPDLALADALAALGASSGLSSESTTEVLRAHLRSLPGWVGHIKWRAEKVGDVDLTSYLAVRLTLIAALGRGSEPRESTGPEPSPLEDTVARAERVTREIVGGDPGHEVVALIARVLAEHPPTEHPLTWQLAYEESYRRPLLADLRAGDAPEDRPRVQLVMCIDPRSEGMRRQLERDDDVETLGFAGFFGVPIRFSRYAARGAVDALPALLAPRHHVSERPLDTASAGRSVSAGRRWDALAGATRAADEATATPFALAETAGWFYGARSALRTLAPGLDGRLARLLSPGRHAPSTEVTVADSFTLDERISLAETAVRMMGLHRFAPLIVLAGHGSLSTNNLYESALDCGACGGNPGAANARAAASIFNDPLVRSSLRERGIDIPDDTHFVAAEHNTVTDELRMLDPHLIPATHAAPVQEFLSLQRDAGDRLTVERASLLPGSHSRTTPAQVRRRAHDWAEVYPELGLLGNAAMIIGPREISRGCDLERRVFLHSYRAEMDPDGTALETIMTAPLIVAQWINHQYYFSALNPATLGAGTKTVHNAIGTIGVLSGHGGDLRRGLPWQSVGLGSDLLHEPLRLSVIVQAPIDRIGRIISGNQVLRNLLDNEWISLTARETSHSSWLRYTAYGWDRLDHTPHTEGHQQ